MEIHKKVSQSIRKNGWMPDLFRSIIREAKESLQGLIHRQDIPPKPILDIDMAESHGMQNLMLQIQGKT